jgi:hypothetical protein
MSRMTKEHLAWRDLRETHVSEGLSTYATQADQDLRISGQASLGNVSHGHGTKN